MAQVIRPDSFIENATIIYLTAAACACDEAEEEEGQAGEGKSMRRD